MILVIKENNHFVYSIDSESLGIVGIDDHDYMLEDNIPVFKANLNPDLTVIAFGDKRFYDLLRDTDMFPNEISIESLTLSFLPKYKKLLRDYNLAYTHNNLDVTDLELIIIYKDQLYEIDIFFIVSKVTGNLVKSHAVRHSSYIFDIFKQNTTAEKQIKDIYKNQFMYSNNLERMLLLFASNSDALKPKIIHLNEWVK